MPDDVYETPDAAIREADGLPIRYARMKKGARGRDAGRDRISATRPGRTATHGRGGHSVSKLSLTKITVRPATSVTP